MFSDSSPAYKEAEYPSLAPLNVEVFEPIIGKDKLDRLKAIAQPLKGRHWVHVSSTFAGGGVAEMLQSIVPITRGLDINSSWYCIEGEDEFFVTTKKFHNAIQGVQQDFSLDDLRVYIDTNKANFNGSVISGDMIVVHDPQPCASIVHGNYLGNTVWRCHIDTTSADPLVWDFLSPYINNYQGAIFSMDEFVRPGIKVPNFIITPAINPLSVKNRQRTHEEAAATVADLFAEHHIDPSRPMLLAVSRYDVHKNQGTIIQAFKQMKQAGLGGDEKPILLLVGNLAADDPEGSAMYKKIQAEIGEDPDIFALLNIPDNDENIGALMRLAIGFIHVSTREGFGLVVTEAMWQGTPVIGSNVGGITLQVIEEETGYVVDPFDKERIAEKMGKIVRTAGDGEAMRQRAIDHVRDNFLITTQIEKYLLLMRYLLGIDSPRYPLAHPGD